MARMVVKVFGERNTGTRAVIRMLHDVPGVSLRVGRAVAARAEPDRVLEAAIEAHFSGLWRRQYLHALRDDAAVIFGTDDQWKHAAPRLTDNMIAAGIGTLLLVRDPYSWAVSLARNPYHRKGPRAATLEEFLDRPWLTERRDGLPSVLRSPMHLWSAKLATYQSYQAAAEQEGLPVAAVAFEQFVKDPTSVLIRALRNLGIDREVPDPLTLNIKDPRVSVSALQGYYADEGWLSALTSEAVRRINAFTDWPVAEAFGYARRDPADFPNVRPRDVDAELRYEMSGLGRRNTLTIAAE